MIRFRWAGVKHKIHIYHARHDAMPLAARRAGADDAAGEHATGFSVEYCRRMMTSAPDIFLALGLPRPSLMRQRRRDDAQRCAAIAGRASI